MFFRLCAGVRLWFRESGLPAGLRHSLRPGNPDRRDTRSRVCQANAKRRQLDSLRWVGVQPGTWRPRKLHDAESLEAIASAYRARPSTFAPNACSS